MKFSEFIKDFAQTVKAYIAKYEEYSELTNEQKKERVDEIITNYLEMALDNLGLNIVFKYVVKKLILANVPVLTQVIFDLIKSKVKGITE